MYWDARATYWYLLAQENKETHHISNHRGLRVMQTWSFNLTGGMQISSSSNPIKSV